MSKPSLWNIFLNKIDQILEFVFHGLALAQKIQITLIFEGFLIFAVGLGGYWAFKNLEMLNADLLNKNLPLLKALHGLDQVQNELVLAQQTILFSKGKADQQNLKNYPIYLDQSNEQIRINFEILKKNDRREKG